MSNDWMPSTRAEQISVAEDWITYVTAARASAWGLPAQAMTELAALTSTAKALLDIVDSPERTSVKVAECNTAFDALRARMRDLKRRYFMKPPLQDADLVAMHLPIPDTVHSEIQTPEIHVGLSAAPSANREIEIERIVLETGSRAEPYGMIGAELVEKVGGDPPADPEKMTNAMLLKRHRTTRVYAEEDRRKPVWYSARWVNNRSEPGPWCDIVETTIP